MHWASDDIIYVGMARRVQLHGFMMASSTGSGSDVGAGLVPGPPATTDEFRVVDFHHGPRLEMPNADA
ncbi:hypothetical protein BR93DRAFT_147459 [Coniochaeta sp. PMI_546]|nr:hypothetical protein BR93DRAFT_147459 [Coniochaeta sp. PMI_546]